MASRSEWDELGRAYGKNREKEVLGRLRSPGLGEGANRELREAWDERKQLRRREAEYLEE